MVSTRLESKDGDVGLLYREPARDPGDSGWRVFRGDEDGAFLANAANLLARPAPCAFERKAAGVLQEVAADLSEVTWTEPENPR